jgi:hypothetical protein
MGADAGCRVRSSRWLLFFVGFLAVSYPLSIGPVLWLCVNSYLPQEAFVIYWPILCLAERSDWCGMILLKYTSFIMNL